MRQTIERWVDELPNTLPTDWSELDRMMDILPSERRAIEALDEAEREEYRNG